MQKLYIIIIINKEVKKEGFPHSGFCPLDKEIISAFGDIKRNYIKVHRYIHKTYIYKIYNSNSNNNNTNEVTKSAINMQGHCFQNYEFVIFFLHQTYIFIPERLFFINLINPKNE